MLGNTDYIGIDIGQYAIKIARVKGGKSFTANLLAYEIITEEQRDKDSLKNIVNLMLKHLKISKGQPVIHINFGETILRDVSVNDNVTGENLEGAIELELAPALPFSIDQVYFDFDDNTNIDGSYKVVAARRDIVDQKTALFANRVKTLNAPQVDVDAFAFERLAENLSIISSGSANAILDIGYNRSRLMVYQDGEYVFGRELQIGGNQVNEIIRDVFDISLADAETRKLDQSLGSQYEELILGPYSNSLAEQLNLAVDFYEASSEKATRIEHVYVTGGGSQLSGLVERLQMLVTIPIDILDLTRHIKLQSGLSTVLQNGASHSLAIGLAMEGK